MDASRFTLPATNTQGLYRHTYLLEANQSRASDSVDSTGEINAAAIGMLALNEFDGAVLPRTVFETFPIEDCGGCKAHCCLVYR